MASIVKTRIVVLGGGFGGCFATRRLESLLGNDPSVEISLVNRENYFVFQPLLAEVASGSIIPHQIVNPIRRMLRRTRFYESEVDAIDLEARRVAIRVGEGRRLLWLPYDHLVIALGTIVNLSGLPGMAEHSLPMKNLGDAFYLRNHAIGCLELADIEPDPALKQALLNFVVIGGGFSGVETIGEMQELVRAVLPSYPNLRRDEIHFTLVQSQARLLPEVVPGLADYARRQLESRGIEVLLSTRCMAATHDAVLLHGGRRIPTRTLISTIGNAPHPLLGLLPCAQQKGRLKTDTNLAVLGAPGVWAVGDCAWVLREGSEQPYAPTAQNAVRQARRCAENIVAVLRGEPPKAFHFDELGKLASIGQRSAVAEVLGIRFSGFVAWFVWRTVYLLKLPGWERRLRVAIDWTLDLLFRRDLTQLKLFRSEKVDQVHYEPGEVIVNQGEIGDSFYIIVGGEVEVVREEQGAGETRLATLGAGEHFGEVALLQKIPRTATVRAMTATDLLSIGRGDFEAVARSLNLVKAGLAEVVKKRSPVQAADAPKRETSPPN